MKKLPRIGSTWSSAGQKKFRVLATVVELDKTWIHYISVSEDPPTEHSCYLESFLERFREETNNH